MIAPPTRIDPPISDRLIGRTDIIGTNLLTKFHEDRKINVASRVKIAPPPGSHFHEDRKINVASRVLTRKNAPPHGGHVFQPTGIIFEFVQDIIGINLLTKFHEDWKINAASRVLTRFYYSHIRKNAPPLGSHVFQAKVMIFKLIQDIMGTNLLTKFHEDGKINEASKVLTRKNVLPPSRHVFQPTGIIFVLVQDIIGINLLTKIYEDQTINVASTNVTIFKHIQDIFETNLLTKFHEDRKINVTSREKCPAPGGHVFQPTGIIFKLVQDIIGMNLLTKFYEDQTINVASRVFTRFYYSHIRKNVPPLGSHVFQANVTIFELIQDIIETNLLTKFHEDQKINVASGVFTGQMLTTHNTQRTKGDHKKWQQ
ncbi:hypothetical protein DPMN_173924 [Dreissena polymorpha]|uniref:Uncharacterized protein n=1 Tax=Dreissena polymorpha TaxID=45954 RepID=A0A9D4E3S8_DREPO|nr:hypothetical protein DPMN_173924 [Dreissena polymorpha]